MKKLLLGLVSLCLLAGCTSGSADIKDRSEVLVKVGNQTITKGQIYDMMFAANGANQVINDAIKYIVEQEVEVTDAMNEEAKALVEMQKQIYQDKFADLLKNGEYKDEQDYIERALLPNIKTKALITKYVNENQASMFETYKPRKIQVMSFKDEAIAKEALAAINDNQDFTAVATDKKSTVDSSEKTVTTKSEYPLAVKLFIQDTKEPKTSDIIFDEDNATYYIVKMINADPTTFEEDAAKAVAGIEEVSQMAITHFITKHELQVYDQMLYDAIKEAYPDYLK